MIYNFDFWLTTYCQAKCRSCARTNQETGATESWLTPSHMKLDTFKNRLNGFSHKIGYIQFCGEMGDPCMHPQINEFVETSLEYTDDVHILTNGGLRQPEWYKELAFKYTNFRGLHTGVSFKFAVDGTDHDTNWLYREGVDFERAYKNMEAWFTYGGRGAWHFLIFDWNWHQIPEAVRMAKEIDAELNIKFNTRSFGKITEENKKHAVELLKEFYVE